jgi:DNA-binding winged helix-turn-helix (wHTH) protein
MTSPTNPHRVFRFGAFEIDLQNRELRKGGLRVKLERQPFELLAALVERGGQVVSREELRLRLWPDQPFGDHDHSLRKSVNKVRAALGDSAQAPRFLETLPGLGYRFSGAAELVDGHLLDRATDASRIPAFPARTGLWARISPRLLLPALAILVVSLVVTIAVLAWRSDGARRGPVLAPVPLTTYLGSEISPAFSPDGQEVAFCWNGERQDNLDIYVTRIGAATRRLTQDARRDYSPAWSPDGKQVAFVRETGQGTAEIRVVPADGGQERLLARIGLGRGVVSGPPDRVLAWTRDPRWLVIADAESPAGPRALFLLSIENGQRRRLTAPSGEFTGDQDQAVSPDGRRLAFTRFISLEFQDVYVLAGC